MKTDTDRKPAGSNQGFPEDYHEYVFKDGKLVGDFDNMYRHAKGIPWNQDQHCDRWYTEVGMLMLKDKAPYESILEIGCGLGYIAAKLKEFVSRDDSVIEAFDISEEAIRKAKNLHAGITFYVDNISLDSFQPRRQYDLVVAKDVIWYVFDQMESVIRNIDACVKPKGLLYIGQSFPNLESQFVGKGVIPSPDSLRSRFAAFNPLYTALLQNHSVINDGPILHYLGMRI